MTKLSQPQEKNWRDNKYLEVKEHPVSNKWFNQKIKEDIKIYMKTNENENMTVQALWDAAKAVIRGKYIAI